MLGRREFGMAGLSAVALAAWNGQANAQEKNAAGVHEHAEMFETCAKACSDCQRHCNSCATHCARMLEAGKKTHFATLMNCRDCATICSAAAEVVARGGPFAGTICTACAKACGDCAAACEKFPDDKHMQECAAECRKCEKACKAMLTHAG